jgi:carbamoyltransferase
LTKIIGISSFYHDSAACLISNGNIISASQEERFTRIKHDNSFPKEVIKFILSSNRLKLNDIDYFVFYEKPFVKFERLVETYTRNAPSGFSQFSLSMPQWVKEKIFTKYTILEKLKEIDNKFIDYRNKIFFSDHHLSHAASAFFPSPFQRAAILTIDGVGEWSTTTLSLGTKNSVNLLKEIKYPCSIGLLYSAFTYYAGFKVNGGEYKLMGLAPYGESKYENIILKNLIDIKEDGSFKINQEYFDYSTGFKMINYKFEELFKKKIRNPKQEQITQFHMDIACSIQSVIEKVILKLANSIKKETEEENLCLAGGVALNCVANGKILKENIFKKIWIQPAAGDAGGSLGAALSLYYMGLKKNRIIEKNDSMRSCYLGEEFSEIFIKQKLVQIGADFEECNSDKLIEICSKNLSQGKVIGWFQDRAEFGPRALGNRSILADPRSVKMQNNINLKIKFRESFRPFAPIILYEDLNEWFDLNIESKYMMFVGDLNKKKRTNNSINALQGIEKLKVERSAVSAITHVNYSARIQTLKKPDNPKLYNLIKAFKEITNCPILVNTSFNIRGEPIVNTIEDAYKCFLVTDMDILVCGNNIIFKK